ncbi:MAG: MMPL family transporter, partial [Planctomycetaceae bacterium]|nr:MMPL family transporter [Planctomycetaceae bacterium]
SLLVAKAELLQALALQAALGTACCYVCLMLIVTPTLVICGSRLCAGGKAESHPESPVATMTNGDAVSRKSIPPGEQLPQPELATREMPPDTPPCEMPPAKSFYDSLGRIVCARAVPIVVLHIGIAAATLWVCRNMPINSYMFETYDGDHPTMEVVRLMDERMSGLVSLEVQIQTDSPDRLFDQDLAAALARIRQRLRQDSRITFYRDYVEFLAVFDHNRALAASPEAAAASLRRIRLVLKQLDRPEATDAFLSTQPPVGRMMMRLRDIGSAPMQKLFTRVAATLKEELPPDVRFRLTGDAWLHAICMDEFIRDLFYSLVAASGIIFALISLLFRSLRIGLISAVPNLFPLVMTLGYMHLRGYELSAGNTIVFAISLGIAVDDTIHFLARYRDTRRRADRDGSIILTLASSGKAIVLTSILVISGLSVLIFSDFVPTRHFAELAAVTMFTALSGDLVLLPALLKIFGTHRAKPEP